MCRRPAASNGWNSESCVAVEFERRDARAGAQLAVEGRRAFHPGAADLELGIRVPEESVALDQFAQPLRIQVIAHVGKADARRNADGARARRQQRGFAGAEAAPAGEHRAGAEHVGVGVVEIRIVGDAVAHGIIKRDGARLVAGDAFDGVLREGAHGRLAAVDEARRLEIIRFGHAALHKGRLMPPSIAGRGHQLCMSATSAMTGR